MSSKLLRRGFRRIFGGAFSFDLPDGVHDGVKGQHGRRMPRLVVTHRLEHRDIGPLAARWRLAALLQHLAHGFTEFAKLLGLRADDVARHDRRRSLAKRTGLHFMSKVGHRVAVHLQIDRNGRSAQPGMRGRGGAGIGEAADSRNRPRKLDNSSVVDFVQHRNRLYRHRRAAARDRGFAVEPCNDRMRRPRVGPVFMSHRPPFAAPGSGADLEEGLALTPKFAADGTVICVATDAASGEVLMVAHMNAEALAKTIAPGQAWYYSPSRGG